MKTLLILAATLTLTYASPAASQCLPNTWGGPIQISPDLGTSAVVAPSNAGLRNGGTPSNTYKVDRQQLQPPSVKGLAAPMNACFERQLIEEWSGWVTDHDVGELTQRIVVVGQRWTGGWTTVCRGEDCADFFEDMYSRNNWVVEAFIDLMDVREVAEKACSNVARQPTPENRQTVANTTSRSDDISRLAAATAIWGFSMGRQQAVSELTSPSLLTQIAYRLNQGYDVTFTYSDGGTEVYKFVLGLSPELARVEGSLVQRDGVSECPQ